MGVIILLLINIPLSILSHKLIRSGLSASLAAAGVATILLQLVAYWIEGTVDAFILIGLAYGFLVSFAISYLFGFLFRRWLASRQQH